MESVTTKILLTFILISAIFCVIFGVLGFYNSQDKICENDAYKFYKGTTYTNTTLIDMNGDYFLQYREFNASDLKNVKVCFLLEAETDNGIKAYIINQDFKKLGTIFIMNGTQRYCVNIDYLADTCEYLPTQISENQTYIYGNNYTSYHWEYGELLPNVEDINLFHSYSSERFLYEQFCSNTPLRAVGLIGAEVEDAEYFYAKTSATGTQTQQLYYDGSAYYYNKESPLVIDYNFYNGCNGLVGFFFWSYVSIFLVFGFILLLIFGFKVMFDNYEDMIK